MTQPSPSRRGRWLALIRYAALFVALLGLHPLERVLTLNVGWDTRVTFLTERVGLALLPILPRVGGGLALLGALADLALGGTRADLDAMLAGGIGLAALLLGRERKAARTSQGDTRGCGSSDSRTPACVPTRSAG